MNAYSLIKNVFSLVLKQSGEGCDYMIGCGTCVVDLKATTLQEATQEVQAYLEGRPHFRTVATKLNGDDTVLVSAQIVRTEIDVLSIVEDLVKERILEEQKAGVAEKMAQLERLKKELGVE